MRWLSVGLACLALAGCGKAPGRDGPGDVVTTASDVAFAYRYDFRLPSSRIADIQEAHARACEQLAPGRCRITGMTYRLDEAGQVAVSLDVRVAAPIARAFGRRGVQSVEAAGGALDRAEICGMDVRPAMDAAKAGTTDASAESADIDRALDRRDLTPAVRRDLLARRAELTRLQNAAGIAAAEAEASVSMTPIGFTYAAGAGAGLTGRLGEAARAGYVSLTWTLAIALTSLAYLGPPLAMLLLLGLLWHRFGRGWWARAFRTDEGR